MDSFQPIKSIKIYEQVIEQIKELIFHGKLRIGDKLPSERELKEQLNVSRASIREAFRVLEITGIIESRPGEGTFIKDFRNGRSMLQPLSLILMLGDNVVEELFELRKIIEIETAYLAAINRTDEDLAEIKKYFDISHDNINDDSISTKADTMFHCAIATASKNIVFYDIISSILLAINYQMEKIRPLVSQDINITLKYQEQHNDIYLAIKEQCPEKAKEAMKNHFDYVIKSYRG